MATPTNLPPGSQRLPFADDVQKALEPLGLRIKEFTIRAEHGGGHLTVDFSCIIQARDIMLSQPSDMMQFPGPVATTVKKDPEVYKDFLKRGIE